MKYKINKGLITEEIDGDTVIYDGDKSVLYTFNSTASYIFKKLKQGKEKKTIIDLMSKRYKIPKERAAKDVDDLISELLKNKVVS